MNEQHSLYYSGPGVYVPSVVLSPNSHKFVTWRRDESGNPIVGVQVDNMRSARRIGKVARNTRWGYRFEGE